jgi:hypothetical protein
MSIESYSSRRTRQKSGPDAFQIHIEIECDIDWIAILEVGAQLTNSTNSFSASIHNQPVDRRMTCEKARGHGFRDPCDLYAGNRIPNRINEWQTVYDITKSGEQHDADVPGTVI